MDFVQMGFLIDHEKKDIHQKEEGEAHPLDDPSNDQENVHQKMDSQIKKVEKDFFDYSQVSKVIVVDNVL